jgi:hypothetical protein
MSSFSRISARTLDYLARRHPWLGAIFRNRWLAAAFFASYLGSLAYFFGTIYANGGGVELVKSYSPLLFDLLVVFVISVLFMVLRAYYIEERSRIDPLVQPDPRFFMSLAGQQISFQMTDDFFSRHGAVEAILDALPLDQSDFFLAHAGSLDIPKLRLMSVTQRDGVHEWQLGMASFKEFFFTHHFADYVLSRSSSKDSTRLETLRTVFADAYVKAYGPFFGNKCNQLPLMPYTPNTLGVTGLVRVVCGADSLLVLQRRGMHESAARGHVQLSYAGTINALPHYAFPRSMANDQKKGQTNDLAQLANGEFLDELMNAENDQKNGQSIDLTQLADDEFLDELMNAPDGQSKFPHPWPPQIPPGSAARL